MAKILVVEDDKELNKIICNYFEISGYKVVGCYNGVEALAEIEKDSFDLIISDIMMPQMDGFTMLEKVRNKNSQIPVIFMSARDDKFSKQLGYKIGVDDYIVKPFDIDELVLKVGAMLRRVTAVNSQLTLGNLMLDSNEHTAYLDGEELNLTVREFDLLFKLVSNPKKTFTRSQLMEEFWDFDSSATSRTVDVYMAKLRDKTSKCDAFSIVTVHGLGYKVVLNEK
ncbi:MAG: response regulator transcription factor [Clostridia bacterium]|nr:response regulator transcription factor [Clostridia bacterium]MBQ9792354.1 response regulator transcription factor [Clostridia bacterium]MBQ9793276.1 response regulator transcription factor [Clostridia bacterium]